jgi:hypothetical protein
MKIWITYAFEDRAFVKKITEFLLAADIEVLDIENKIQPGDNIIVAIADAIEEAEVILVVVSKSSHERQWFSAEIGLIISEIRKNSQKKIIPILKDRDAIIPPFIDQYAYLDLTEKEAIESQLKKLLSSLKLKRNFESEDKKLYVESELTFSREEMLKLEKIEYEQRRRQNQKLVSITFLTTILASFIAIFSFLFSGKGLLNLDIKYATIITLLTGTFIGVIVSLILNQFNKK